jgi:hypothetical protein
MLKRDSVALGVMLGLLGPVAGFCLYSSMRFGTTDYIAFLKRITEMHLSSAFLSLSLLANLGIFFIFIHYKYDYSARGVLMATIIYAIIGFLLKFLL